MKKRRELNALVRNNYRCKTKSSKKMTNNTRSPDNSVLLKDDTDSSDDFNLYNEETPKPSFKRMKTSHTCSTCIKAIISILLFLCLAVCGVLMWITISLRHEFSSLTNQLNTVNLQNRKLQADISMVQMSSKNNSYRLNSVIHSIEVQRNDLLKNYSDIQIELKHLHSKLRKVQSSPAGDLTTTITKLGSEVKENTVFRSKHLNDYTSAVSSLKRRLESLEKHSAPSGGRSHDDRKLDEMVRNLESKINQKLNNLKETVRKDSSKLQQSCTSCNVFFMNHAAMSREFQMNLAYLQANLSLLHERLCLSNNHTSEFNSLSSSAYYKELVSNILPSSLSNDSYANTIVPYLINVTTVVNALVLDMIQMKNYLKTNNHSKNPELMMLTQSVVSLSRGLNHLNSTVHSYMKHPPYVHLRKSHSIRGKAALETSSHMSSKTK